MHGLQRLRARLEVTNVEVRQGVIDEAVHGAVGAVHVLVDEPWDEVGGEGDDEGLRDRRMLKTGINYKQLHEVTLTKRVLASFGPAVQ